MRQGIPLSSSNSSTSTQHSNRKLKIRYSIKEMEKLSGIKAHTLRIWEKRYQLITPKRTETNIRIYTEADLNLLMDVSLLYRKGYKISKIAVMDKGILKAKIIAYKNSELDPEAYLDSIMRDIKEMDKVHLSNVLDQHISKRGLEQTMRQLIFPLLDKLNLAWIAGSFTIAHQVFISELIKNKIQSEIDNLDVVKASSQCLVYLSPEQQQELSILFFHYLLKKNNFKVRNLGSQVSLSEICSNSGTHSPEFIFTILNQNNRAVPLQQYLDELTMTFPETKILILGYQTVALDINWPEKVIRCYQLSQAIDYIKEYGKKCRGCK